MSATTVSKVECRECSYKDHILIQHIISKHEMSPTDYITKHPDASLWSAYGFSKIQEHSKSKAAKMTPRSRKSVYIKKLFPTFGKHKGFEIEGDYPIFETPGLYTPPLDEFYIFPEEQTLDLLAIIEKRARNRVYIKGWSGTGKTQLCFNLAAKLNAEVMEWNADSFQQRSTLIGHWTVKDGQTVWQY